MLLMIIDADYEILRCFLTMMPFSLIIADYFAAYATPRLRHYGCHDY